MSDGRGWCRREFVLTSGSCLAHLAFARPGWGRGGPPQAVVAQEPWGRLEQIGDGAWALISAPLDDRTTLCNGGIVAGTSGTLVFESFASARGATWMAEQARRLTGRWPTHVVVSHFHGDHANGFEGFAGTEARAPALHVTARTRDLIAETDAGREGLPDLRGRLLRDARVIPADRASVIDLGGRTASVRPADGHTPSDVSVSVDEPALVFAGDLVWNHMFPNYRDAIPSRLSTAVRALSRLRGRVYVPGHGALADAADLANYVAVIDAVEGAARAAVEAGRPADEAAAAFALPASLGEWMLFSPRYYEVAFRAWERELQG